MPSLCTRRCRCSLTFSKRRDGQRRATISRIAAASSRPSSGCVAFFFCLELFIFIDHYYLLHKWEIGKKLGQHAYHHVYKYADQLNAYSGYSFAPQDGWSQGMPLALCTLFVPVPIAFVFIMEVLTGLWTLYIHTDLCPLPWPLMGCDYHYIHHRYNWCTCTTPLRFPTLARAPRCPPPLAPVLLPCCRIAPLTPCL